MQYKNICNSDKYFFYHDTICTPVTFGDLPEEIVVENETFFKKSDFHISLVAMGKIIEKNKITTPEFKESIVSDFCEFVAENPINLIGFKSEYRLASEKQLNSIVAMCDVSNLEEFFAHINEKYSLHLEVPPTHVTLYTSHRNLGIFLTDASDIETMTKVVVVPELFGKI
jgi:hypothetical protein